MNSARPNNRDNDKKHRFIVDFMLGRLAKWLRIIGYDSLYADKNFPENILMKSLKDNRILVTRNSRLSRKRALKLVLIKSDKPFEQLAQLAAELKLVVSRKNFFSRCTFCNTELKQAPSKENVKTLVPQYVYDTHDTFSVCSRCGRVYWAGTHSELLMNTLKKAGLLK